MAGSDINDTVGRIRDLLLSQSKAGRLRGLLDSIYGAAEPVRRIPGLLGQFIDDAAPGGALNPELTPENMRTAAEYASMTPNPIGDVASLGLVADDLRKGDYGSAALNSVGMLPFVPAMGGMVVKIPLDKIEHGESAMPGGKLQWPGARELIKKYAGMETKMPPIEVIPPETRGGKYMIYDGSHRYEAAKLRGDKTIDVVKDW